MCLKHLFLVRDFIRHFNNRGILLHFDQQMKCAPSLVNSLGEHVAHYYVYRMLAYVLLVQRESAPDITLKK